MSLVAFDTETRGLDWFDPDQRAFLVSWADEHGSYVESTEDGAPRFKAAIAKADTLVAHNLAFDVHQVRESIGVDLLTTGHRLLDTDLLARVALPERRFGADGGYKLKALAKTYLRADAQAAEDRIDELATQIGVKLKSTGGYYDVWRAFPEEMEHYALLDAEYARDLLPVLERKLSQNQWRAWELEQKVAPALIRAEQRGVKVDQEVVARLKREYEPLARSLHDSITKELGDEALEGTEALREALLKHGVPLHRTTDTGQLATNKFALQEFEADFPVLKQLSEWRMAEKFLSTYIGPLAGREVVHPSFWQMGAWTSRMSCSRPNMQNIPTRAELGDTPVRACFVPREGYCFVVVDLDSIELRMLAYYLNDPGFIELIESGYDAFAWLASEIDGGSPEQYVKGSSGEKRRGELKNVTYAICYGAGGGRISDMLGLDPGPFYGPDHPAIVAARARGRQWPKEGPQHKEGRAVAKKVKATLPNYDHLNKRIRRKIQDVGFVTSMLGHKQAVNKDKSYVGLNALIQGGAAGIFKQGVLNVEELVRPLGALPVLFVHDEIVVECPVEHAEECLRLTKQGLESAIDIRPALASSGAIAHTNYAEAK